MSGGGRTLLNLADRIDDGTLPATVAVVIASRADVPAVGRAERRGFEVLVADRRDFAAEPRLHDAITSWLVERQVDLVCLCGYVRWLRVDDPFRNRAINIHPALLPSFGGRGMYGLRVHRAVLDSGVDTSGCTVHFVDDQYDHGPIILQRRCPVRPDDTPETLAARVQAVERELVPEAVRLYAAGRLTLDARRVRIASERGRS